jgi:hypothetical protein
MLLPQSSAFAALKNRLNSVSNIGFLYGGPRRYGTCQIPPLSPPSRGRILISPSTSQTAPSYDRATGTRLKREDGNIRWVELLDKFKNVQERARRAQATQGHSFDPTDTLQNPSLTAALTAATTDRTRERSGLPDAPRGMSGGLSLGVPGPSGGAGGSRGTLDPKSGSSSILGAAHKQKSSLPNLGRLGIGGRKSKR